MLASEVRAYTENVKKKCIERYMGLDMYNTQDEYFILEAVDSRPDTLKLLGKNR